MCLRARSSRTTGPKIRVPIGSSFLLTSTAALESKRITEPSGRRMSLAVRTITARWTSPFFTRPRGAASLTETTMMSPTPAMRRFEPPSTLMHWTRLAPLLSATSRLDCIWIIVRPYPLNISSGGRPSRSLLTCLFRRLLGRLGRLRGSLLLAGLGCCFSLSPASFPPGACRPWAAGPRPAIPVPAPCFGFDDLDHWPPAPPRIPAKAAQWSRSSKPKRWRRHPNPRYQDRPPKADKPQGEKKPEKAENSSRARRGEGCREAGQGAQEAGEKGQVKRLRLGRLKRY